MEMKRGRIVAEQTSTKNMLEKMDANGVYIVYIYIFIHTYSIHILTYLYDLSLWSFTSQDSSLIISPGRLVWLRPFDLRLHDNPALWHAAQSRKAVLGRNKYHQKWVWGYGLRLWNPRPNVTRGTTYFCGFEVLSSSLRSSKLIASKSNCSLFKSTQECLKLNRCGLTRGITDISSALLSIHWQQLIMLSWFFVAIDMSFKEWIITYRLWRSHGFDLRVVHYIGSYP